MLPRNSVSVGLLVLGLASLYPMQRWIDRVSPRPVFDEEVLYFSSGEAIKKMSLGHDGLIADIYWMRTVQYFGRKVLDGGQSLATNTRNTQMKLLAPLLRIIVNLDPHHIPAYRFGAIFLPERDLPAALELLEHGVKENPNEWRLYQDLAYINWQAGKDADPDSQARYYSKSADWYERGSQVAGAAWWMRDLAGLMRLKGGSREVARTIYSGYLESDDQHIRDQAVFRLKQLRALDEVDAINNLISQHTAKTGACPESLRALAQALRSIRVSLDENHSPVDPDGFPYLFDKNKCLAGLSPDSTIPAAD